MDSAANIVNAKVYTGTWVNWSRGPVMGATLTLTRQNGNLLIAFTAFFIGIISSRAWRIISFSLHRLYSTSQARDALHHQRQAVLRNSETPGWSFWTLGQIAWAWRRSGPRLRMLAIIMPTLVSSVLCVCAFAIASGFSSQMTTGVGDEVLIDGTNCGMASDTGGRNVKFSSADILQAREDSRRRSDAVNYAQQCYDGPSALGSDISAGGVFDCNLFVVPSLSPRSINTNAPCPFTGGICQSESSNLLLDTGYIDTHEHLGVNSPKEDRISVRQTYHCAPLRTDGFKDQKEVNGVNYTIYNYGQTIRIPYNTTTGAMDRVVNNYTMMVRGLDSQYPAQNKKVESPVVTQANNYIISVYQSQTVNRAIYPNSTFVPIPDLQKPDGSVEVIFLTGNGIGFVDQTSDPWYRVSNVTAGTITSIVRNGAFPYYRPSEAASPLGCVEQFQFCRSSDQECGPLAAWMDAILGAAHLFDLTPDEVLAGEVTNGTTATSLASRYIWYSMIMSYLPRGASQVPSYASSRKLLSEQTLNSGFQFGLRDDQWKADVSHWWFTWLSLLQISFLDVAKGPPPSFLADDRVILARPMDQQQKDMCFNQKIQSRRHVSFSLFGIYFVYITGGLIFITSYVLEPIFASKLLRRCRRERHDDFKNLEWNTTDVLHLQALSFEGQGRGTWFDFGTGAGAGAIPITTEPGEIFQPLIIGNADASDVTTRNGSSKMGSRGWSGDSSKANTKVEVVEIEQHTELQTRTTNSSATTFLPPHHQDSSFTITTIDSSNQGEEEEKMGRAVQVSAIRT